GAFRSLSPRGGPAPVARGLRFRAAHQPIAGGGGAAALQEGNHRPAAHGRGAHGRVAGGTPRGAVGRTGASARWRHAVPLRDVAWGEGARGAPPGGAGGGGG